MFFSNVDFFDKTLQLLFMLAEFFRAVGAGERFVGVSAKAFGELAV